MRLVLRNRFLDFRKPVVMGIINVTPDSFSDGGNFLDPGTAIDRAAKLIDEGADILDIGGESTRPGAGTVDTNQELERVMPVLEGIKKRWDIPVSIDTYKEPVARFAVEEGGADIVNDISGLGFSSKMAATVAELSVPVVIMHIKGTPENMQKDPFYQDVVNEIKEFFAARIEFAQSRGIAREKIILDPGIGFGKRLEDNIEIIRCLSSFRVFDCPLLLGVSRKSFLGGIAGTDDPAGRGPESLAAGLAGLQTGAEILRVHDVGATVRALKVFSALGGLDHIGS